MSIPRRYYIFSPSVLLKAKRMPIGTVSHGRKKIAEGVWRPIPTGKKAAGDRKPKGYDPTKVTPLPEYARPLFEFGKKYTAPKVGWKNVDDAKKVALDLSKKFPGKRVTMNIVFDTVSFSAHDKVPQGVYAPGDWAHGYAHAGKWKQWSAKRQEKYHSAMIESSEGSDR